MAAPPHVEVPSPLTPPPRPSPLPQSAVGAGAADKAMGKPRDKLSGKGAASSPPAAGEVQEKQQRDPAGSEPVSRALTSSSSLEFAEARRRLLEMERRQRRVRELEISLQQLRDILVRAEQEAVEHGELVNRIRSCAQQGEIGLNARSQNIKTRLKVRGQRAPLIVAAALGLRRCVPWTRK